MATSDSEAFESADEELNDEPLKEQHSSKTIEKKEVISHAILDVNKQVPKVEPTHKEEETKGSSSKIGITNKSDKDTELSKTKPKDLSDKKDVDCDEGWEDFDVDDPVTNKEEEKPTNVEQDERWDFDDWGDEDIKTHVASKPETVHSDKEYKDLADKLSSLGNVGGKTNDNQGGWGSSWGGWGASLLSSGVSQITTHVSQGFNTVSNVIESGMGVPNPEELVKIQRESKLKNQQESPESVESQKGDVGSGEVGEQNESSHNRGGFHLGKFVSSVTKLVESTSTTVITGGLDTLEEIGKRTMKVIQGDEPGGRVKLSTLLREAREESERQHSTHTSEGLTRKKTPSFEILFDDFQGLVHLEALEMLSKQCEVKLQTLANKRRGSELKEFQETLEQVKEICELPDLEEDMDDKKDVESFQQSLMEATKDMGVQLTFELIINCWKEIFDEPSALNVTEKEDSPESLVDDLSLVAIKKLAEYSALSVQVLHKCAALLSVRERRSTADEADGLTQLTAILSHRIGDVASEYSNALNKLSEKPEYSDSVKSAMTNIYLEAEKGSSYIKDAFLLTIPILQVGAT